MQGRRTRWFWGSGFDIYEFRHSYLQIWFHSCFRLSSKYVRWRKTLISLDLERLTICDHNIRDIRPITKLTGLVYLNMSRNQISDIGPLTSLCLLSELHLDHNNICLFPRVGWNVVILKCIGFVQTPKYPHPFPFPQQGYVWNIPGLACSNRKSLLSPWHLAIGSAQPHLQPCYNAWQGKSS